MSLGVREIEFRPTEKDEILMRLLSSAQRTEEHHTGEPKMYGNYVDGKISRQWAMTFYALGWTVEYVPDRGPKGGKLRTGRTRFSKMIHGRFDYRNLMLKYMAAVWRDSGDVFPKKIKDFLKGMPERFFGPNFRPSLNDIEMQLIQGFHWTDEEARNFARLEHEINTNRRKYE